MGFLSKASNKTQASNNDALATINGMPLQAKLRYGKAGDTHEQEADRVADSVVNNSKSAKNTASSPALGTGISNSVQKTSDEKNTSEINKDEPVQKKESTKEEKPVQKKSTDKQDETQKIQKKEGKQEEKPVQKKSAGEEKDKAVQKKENKKEEQSVQKKETNKQEEKPVQKKSAGEEKDKAVQKKENKKEEQPVQKKETNKQEGQPVQKKSAEENKIQKKESDNPKAEEPEIERQILASKNSGKPMDDDVRKEMEHQFGQDFTHVIIHNDALSYELCRKINALAFTHGSHVYFAEGKYDPQTTDGKHLLAHELTHVVQQMGTVQKMVQKANAENESKSTANGVKPTIDFGPNPTINLPLISLPQVKDRDGNNPMLTPPFTYPQNYDRKNSYKDVKDVSSSLEQREVWTQAVKSFVSDKVKDKATEAEKKNAYKGTDSKIYYFQNKTKNNFNLIGSRQTIEDAAAIPTWTKSGNANAFDVDHVRELQLGGANYQTNMELLNFSFNRAAGNAVKNEINLRISNYIEAEKAKGPAGSDDFQKPEFPKDSQTAKKNFSISFQSSDFKGEPKTTGKDHYWTLDEITAGKQLDEFSPMSNKSIKELNATKEKLIYTSPAGGVALTEKNFIAFNGKNINFSGFNFNKDNTTPNKDGSIGSFDAEFTAYGSNAVPKKFKIPIMPMEGVPNGGYIPRRGQKGSGGLEQLIVGLELPGMSPMFVDQADLNPNTGLEIRGRIKATLPIIKDIEIDFLINSKKIEFSKTFSSGELNVPDPFKINNCNITVKGGTDGFGVTGKVDFEIKNIGKGTISGSGDTDGKFGITGHFDFDKKLFKNKSQIDVAYDNENGWNIGGIIDIGSNPKMGIESGQITVSYGAGVLVAGGTAKLSIKGIDDVTLKIKLDKETSEIQGAVTISKLPGIKEGSGNLTIIKTGNDYDISGGGKITPDIPGIETQVDFEFHNNIFLVDVKVDFDKGKLKGKINLGITNRAIGPDGTPTGNALPAFKVFGSSNLQLVIIPDKLSVAADVKFLETGDIEVIGEIILPPEFQVFDVLLDKRKDILPRKPVIIPIFDIDLGVTDIGISAYFTPILNAGLQIGPGTIKNAIGKVYYKVSDPDSLKIDASAELHCIAHADLTAGVEVGLRASLLIAEAHGGVKLLATLAADARQPILQGEISYSPRTGFQFGGQVNAIVDASLDISAALTVGGSVDLLVHTISFEDDYPLGSIKINLGSLGFDFPFNYGNDKLDLTMDQVNFHKPDFNEGTVASIKQQILAQTGLS